MVFRVVLGVVFTGMYLTQRLTLFVLAQDALLLIYAALLLRGALRRPRIALKEAR